jgi:hypothetical protein
MNKRIRELAEQAWKEVYAETEIDGSDNPAPSIDEVVMFEEKFAELIIRECANITLDYKNHDHYYGWMDHGEEIIRHFGIER